MLIKKNPQRIVLCIDDDSDFLAVVQTDLEFCDYKVLTATNGKEGLALALKYFPDVITLDIKMPQRTGWQILRELKTNSRTRNIPIIMLSVLRRPADIKLGLQAGADDYICKPYSHDELCARIESVIYRFHRSQFLLHERKLAEQSRDILLQFLKSTNDIYTQEDIHTQLKLVCQGITASGLFHKIFLIPNHDFLTLEENVCEGFQSDELEKITRDKNCSNSKFYKNLAEYLNEPFRLSKSYFIPEEHNQKLVELKTVKVEQDEEFKFEKSAWKENDILLIPLKDSEGQILGLFSFDEPYNNLRPTIEIVGYLELFADLAAAVIHRNSLTNKYEHFSKRYHTFLSIADEPILVFDKKGKIKEANQPACELFNREIKALVAQNIAQLLDMEEPLSSENNKTFQKRKAVIKNKVDTSLEITLKTFSVGSEVSTIAFLRQDASSSPQPKLDSQWYQVFDVFLDPIALTNLDGNLISANKAFYSAFELTENEPVGINIATILTDFKEIRNNISQTDREHPISFRINHLANHYEVTELPIKKDDTSQLVHIFRNVTAIERITKELNKSEKLIVLQQLATTIKEELERIQWFAKDNTPSNYSITKLDQQIELLVNKLNLYIKVKAQADVVFCPFSTISKAISNIQIPNEKNITINFLKPKYKVFLVGNELQFREAIIQILTNSIQAINDVGSINIEVTEESKKKPTSSDSEYITISIADSGSGIDETIIYNVIEPFFTTHDNTLGMGLTLANSVIHAHKGKLEIESTINQGTKVGLTLPVLYDLTKIQEQNYKVHPKDDFQILVTNQEESVKNRLLDSCQQIRISPDILFLNDIMEGDNLKVLKNYKIVFIDLTQELLANKTVMSLLNKQNDDFVLIGIPSPNLSPEVLDDLKVIKQIPYNFDLLDLVQVLCDNLQ
jgi:DNA-binding response OmpR family regulator/signal transduction histidine kinase